MAIVVPDVGEVKLLNDLLAGGTLENWTLKLFKNDLTPTDDTVIGDFTEADFTNYATKTLTRAVGAGNWGTPATAGGTTSSTYNSGTPLSWTCGASGNTIYGYYVVGATSGTLLFCERFATARVLASTDVLNLTPVLQLA